jgi:hypothetical protein
MSLANPRLPNGPALLGSEFISKALHIFARNDKFKWEMGSFGHCCDDLGAIDSRNLRWIGISLGC